MPNLFRTESSDPKTNAQRNLSGRTHYVDDDTLRFHKSRVLSARSTDNGLLFTITTSDSADYENTKRVFRYVVFDMFGEVLARPKLEDGYRTHNQALTAMWRALNQINAKEHTLAAIRKQQQRYLKEMAELKVLVSAFDDTVQAA